MKISKANAPDSEILLWARKNSFIVFTHDLDFGILLALTYAKGPSVIQVRTQDILPAILGTKILTVLSVYKLQLDQGALITLDENSERVKILPIS